MKFFKVPCLVRQGVPESCCLIVEALITIPCFSGARNICSVIVVIVPKIIRILFNFYNIMYKNRTGFVYNSVGLQCHGPQPSDLQRW